MSTENLDKSYGFVILSPEHNVGRVKSSLNAIKEKYPKAPVICVIGADAKDKDVKEMEQLCPVLTGKNTITSLINAAMKNGHDQWSVFLMEGANVDYGVVKKLFLFVKSIKDIMFAAMADYDYQGRISQLHIDFLDCSLNGLTMHKDTFKEIGDFSDNPWHMSKLMWALSAKDCECTFKGVVGAKFI